MRRTITFNRRRRVMVPRTRPTTRSVPDNTHQLGNSSQATIPHQTTTSKATTLPNQITTSKATTTTTTTNKPPSKPNYFQGSLWSKFRPHLCQRNSQFIINKRFIYIQIPQLIQMVNLDYYMSAILLLLFVSKPGV